MPDELSAEADSRTVDDILARMMYPDMAAAGVPLPQPRPTDLPMTGSPQNDTPLPPPKPNYLVEMQKERPSDIIAQANAQDYFDRLGKRGRTAAGAQAMPSQLIPDTQRRSGNVELPPANAQAMHDEIPEQFFAGSAGGVGHDLETNPHSREYIEETLRNMKEGALGQTRQSGENPFFRRELPQASTSPLAKQLGMQALREMMMANAGNADNSTIENILTHNNYDAAIAKAQGLLDDYNAP